MSLRPLGIPSTSHPSYSTDGVFSNSIINLCKDITLGGNKYDLKIRKTHIFQGPSHIVNIQSYAIDVDDVKLIDKIIQSSANFDKFVKKLKTPFEKLKITGGVLALHRRAYKPSDSRLKELVARFGSRIARRTSVLNEDDYWLDVYVKGSPFAVIRVFHDSVGPNYMEKITSEEELVEELEEIRPFYPEPNDVVLNWHETAFVLGIEKSVLYIRACFRGAGATRIVSANYGGPDILIYDPRWPYYGTMAVAEDPNFVIPGHQFNEIIRNMFMYQYKILYICEDPECTRPDYPGLDYHKHLKTLEPEALPPPPPSRDDVRVFIETDPPVPTPDTLPDEHPDGLAFVQGVMQRSNGAALYLGAGMFRFKSDNLLELAAGSGNWTGGEGAIVSIAETASKGSSAGAVGTGVGVGAAVLEGVAEYYSDKRDREIDKCVKTSISVADCRDCIAKNAGWIQAADSLGSAGMVAAGVIAAVAATGVGFILAGIALAALAAYSLYRDGKEIWEEYARCNQDYIELVPVVDE